MEQKKRSERILFLINIPTLEKSITESLKAHNFPFELCGNLIDARNLEDRVKEINPTIFVIREEDEKSPFWANKNDMLPCIYKLLATHKDLRIIFIAKNREIGDKLLADLVTYGVNDIIRGSRVTLENIVSAIMNPTPRSEAVIYLPKPDGADYNSKLFESEESNQEPQTEGKANININLPINLKIPKIKEKTILSKIDIDEDENDQNLQDKKKKIGGSLLDRFKKRTLNNDDTLNKEPLNNENEEAFHKEDNQDSNKASQQHVQQSENYNTPQQSYPQYKEHEQRDYIAAEQLRQMQQLLEEQNRRMAEMEKAMKAQEKQKSVKTKEKVVYKSKKIITFFGYIEGVGTTSVALNTAAQLADMGKSVLFIELNDKKPCVPYWYNMGHDKLGIDVCLQDISDRNLKSITKSIITRDFLLDLPDDPCSINYKNLPRTLSYLFFSKKYISLKGKAPINENDLKELYMILLNSNKYDYLIIDVNPYIEQNLIETSLIHSTYNVFVLNQNISTVSYNLKFLLELSNRGIVFDAHEEDDVNPLLTSNKNFYVLNRFNKKCKFGPDTLREWFRLDSLEKVLIVPDDSDGFENCIFEGFLPIKESTNRYYRKSIDCLCSKII